MIFSRLSGFLVLAVTAAGAVNLSSAVPAAAGADPWHRPQCGVVQGDGSATFTRTDGAVLARTATALTPVAYTKIAALSTPNTLVAISKRAIQRSTDAGCSWQQVGTTDRDLAAYDVAGGPANTAYVYGINDQPIYRVQGDRITTVDGPVPDDGVVALAVDPADPQVLRAVSKAGQVYDSGDGGATWAPVGLPVGPAVFLYKAAVDPTDRDHVVAGTMGDVTFVTFDGGHSWVQSTGTGPGRSNGFTVAISPADPQTVWVEGYDLSDTDNDNGVRHIWRSTDGGRSFASVLDGLQATLYNGNPLWPSPVDPDVLYFEFGTWFSNYGTDLYRYDASTGRLTSQHNTYDSITSVAFNPVDPQVMYLGLTEER
ncbi:WD40/YVTN/BNR-like repeat-containing protein [Micromonospora sp. NPDC005806]|uniref:WD40/YVTN/BNR-like repeat-containing protein n=1 Tax=Micromonospora sp. NPDC005806 TaxID=3364234 RepID=UPI0036909F3D